MGFLVAGGRPPPGLPPVLEALMASPWRFAVYGLGVVFAAWALYLAIPSLLRFGAALIDLGWRRSDRRTFAKVAGGGLLGTLGVAGYGALLAQLPPEVQFYAWTGAALLSVILAVLLVVAFITWVTLGAFGLFGGPLLARHYVLFVGWQFLRSHRSGTVSPDAYEGGRRPGWLLVFSAAAAFIALAATAHLWPWSRVAVEADHMVPLLRWGLGSLAALCVLWPLRPHAPVGDIGRVERVLAGVQRLPNILTVSVTTFVSVVGVGVGVWALIVVLSVMAGFEQDLRGKILSTNPHVLVQDVEPMEGIPGYERRLVGLRGLTGVTSAIPYVQGDVIVSARDNRNVSLTIKGIDPLDLAEAEHHLASTVVSGSLDNLLAPERVVSTSKWVTRDDEPPEAPSAPAAVDPLAPSPIPGVDTESTASRDDAVRPTILLGRELAESLLVGVGAEVTLVSPRDDAGFLGIQPRARTFHVGGIFATGMYEFDSKLAYVLLGEAQRFFQMGGDVNRIELRLSEVDRSDEVAEAARSLVTDVPTLEVIDWKGLNKNLFAALMLEKVVMFAVLGVIIMVAALNVFGSLVMIILDKTREIAVLKAMGAPFRSVFTTFLVLGGVIGVVGSSAGLIVGVLTCAGIRSIGIKLPEQYYIDQLPVHLDPATIFAVFGAGILLCAVATIFPAIQASGIDPVEGLRSE